MTTQPGKWARRCILLALLSSAWAAAPGGERAALLLTIDGPIGPASADYFSRGLESAREQGAAVVVLQMDTPGGLDTSMREMIRAIIASPVPVLSYVAPSGARAASAGTYLLYASHIAAMAPGTNLGAATPVQIGGGGPPLPGSAPERPAAADRAPEESADAPGGDPGARGPAAAPGGTAMESKMLNDAVAYIRSLAQMRGRNAEWAEAAVREAASLPASEALERDVIDIVATSLEDLLTQANGREVMIAGNARVTLDTRDLVVRRLDPDWRTRLLATITNPNLALILILVGVYGLFFEFMNPGALVPGTVGAISLLVGLYALSALSVTFAGAALLLLGIALMIAEAFTPSVGILGIGGVVAFVFGAVVLFDSGMPGLEVSIPLVASVAVAGLAFAMLVARLALKSRRSRITTGTQALIGATAHVKDWQGSEGHVFVAGERWAAHGPADLHAGQKVTVTAVDGLQLDVAPVAAGSPQPTEETRHGRTDRTL
jgi:membrane-bound serine protease (ClpP class)